MCLLCTTKNPTADSFQRLSMDISIKLPFRRIVHFRRGRWAGISRPTCFKGFAHYSPRGRCIGKSIRNPFGELNHYNHHGQCTGYTRKANFCKMNHYDRRGNLQGHIYNILGFLFVYSKSITANNRKIGTRGCLSEKQHR